MSKWEPHQIERAIMMGEYLANTRNTLQSIAKQFGVSPTTVRRYLREVLPEINAKLASHCGTILDYHKSIAHLRGGEANKIRHRQLKKKGEFE